MASWDPQPFAPNKLTPPLLHSGLVWRKSLLERLNCSPTRPLTLVTGPAGSGKSTLAAQWLLSAFRATEHLAAPGSLHQPGASRSPVAWLNLDERDQDPLNFLRWVTVAIDQVAPGLLATSNRLLLASDPPSLDAAVEFLLLELHNTTAALTLVLDDYHSITAGAVHPLLTYVIHHLPAHCRMVILSRSDPPLAVSRLRAQWQVTELRADDLRFSEAETAALLVTLTGRTPPGELVATLQQESDGWISGLRLLALAHHATPGRLNQARHQIKVYLSREVFNRQLREIQRALLALALPWRVCSDLGAALLGRPNETVYVEDLLERFERNNLFMIPLDPDGQWHRFHRPFREVLLHRLHHSSDHGLNVQQLHRRAAQWFAAAGLLEEATFHAALSADEEPIYTLTVQRRYAASNARAEPPRAPACDDSALYAAQNQPLPYYQHECTPTATSIYTPPPVTRRTLTEGNPGSAQYEPLTRRESEILALLALRWSDKEIAEQLIISPKTVRRHTSTIYSKLGVHGRREAVAVARQLGLLPAT
ncbi:MAG: LuxR C-terminal-related transcriptional regulator [Oscillochloridaceae bacterium]|nr:LuxR C-terminal-related transcriptional regulator [Oscillochloridaceae bacterium]